jgi:serine/threonine-protein kinase HipA
MPGSSASSLLFELFEGLPRLGPGSASATRRALDAVAGLPERPRVLDAGCGTGASTKILAGALGGEIVAVDIHRPYLDRLERDLAGGPTRARVTTRRADMAALPVPDGSFDLVWSEGAIYLLGFSRGLEVFRRYIKEGGSIAVTDLTWLDEAPPLPVREYWGQAYPAMTTVGENLRSLRARGYEPVDHFPLAPEAWEAYYAPLRSRLPGFLERHADDPAAAALAESVRTEMHFRERHGGSYTYVFYVARKLRQPRG